MPDPNTEHGLRVQLATALRERDEHKARADAATAKAEQYERDWYAAKSEFGDAMAKSRDALAAARRECEGLRKRVREVRADMTPTNMQYEAHFLRQWIVSWAKKLDAALAAPAAGDSK